MARNLFEGLDEYLFKAQQNGYWGVKTNNLVEKRIRLYAGGLVQSFPVIIADRNDLCQCGLITFWNTMENFLWICPKCGFSANFWSRYKAHCLEGYGNLQEPKSHLGRRLSSRVKANMRRYVRFLLTTKRDQRKTVLGGTMSACDGYHFNEIVGVDTCWPKLHERTPEDEIITKDAIQKLKELVTIEMDDRIKEVVKACLEGCEGVEIYKRLVEKGIYSSLGSARTMIRNLRCQGAFDHYAQVLCPA